MVIEREVTVFGLPVKSEPVIPGSEELFEWPALSDAWKKDKIRTVTVLSEDELVYWQGQVFTYNPDDLSLGDRTDVKTKLAKEKINLYLVQSKRNILGKRVRYKWRPNS